jgi:hypothetical protein
MKSLNLLNLYKNEIKKNMLAQVKGGDETKCYCGNNNPMVSTRKTGPSGELCICGDASTSSAGVKNNHDR